MVSTDAGATDAGTPEASSPEDQLKAAVAPRGAANGSKAGSAAGAGKSAKTPKGSEAVRAPGASPAKAATKPAADDVPARVPAARRVLDPVLTGMAGVALGLCLGAAAVTLARGESASAPAGAVQAAVEADRAETARLAGEIERVVQAVAALRQGSEAARGEGGSRAAALTERVGRTEQALTARIAALGERIEQAERAQTARVAALIARSDAKSDAKADAKSDAKPELRSDRAPASPPAPAPAPARTDPGQTGSIADRARAPAVDAKPSVVEGWALRDVYDGTAILENRNRRLVEVGVGDGVPGVGRVEAIERRGRGWVVVTRAGLVTAQPW